MDETRLEAIKGDIQYEVNMTIFTAGQIDRLKKLINEEKEEGKKIEYERQRSAFLESHLIHIRVLREFFTYSRCPHIHRHQALAEEYVEEPNKWQSIRYKMSYIEDPKTKKKLNSLLAHLSYNRENWAAQNEIRWNVDKTKNEIVEAWRVFIDHLPQSRKSWFSIPKDPVSNTEIRGQVSSASTSVTSTFSQEATIP